MSNSMTSSSANQETNPLAQMTNGGGGLEGSVTLSPDGTAPGSGGMPRNPSRFQVNRVDGSDDAGAPDTEAELFEGMTGGDTTVDSDKTPLANETANVTVVADHSCNKQVQFSVGVRSPSVDEPHQNMSTVNYGTTNLKSFRNVQTVERLPHQDHYRNIMSVEGAMAVRPTLAELHERKISGAEIMDLKHFIGQGSIEMDEIKVQAPRAKFGWIKGVLMRCILSILGTMLYLRVSWMTGKVGIAYAGLIILLSSVVTILTTLSMCAICTNGEVKGGGAYFMISRSLGPEFGGSIGLIFSFANAVACGMCVVGFAEPLVDLLHQSNITLMGAKIWDVRVISLITICVLLGIVFIGVGFESKMQFFLLIALALSIVDYVIGTFIPPSKDQIGKGMTGYTARTFSENIVPPPDYSAKVFFEVFAVFFPACTGIMAGANISGDLADPSGSIPKGTLLAILITGLTYFGAVLATGSTMTRHASGIPIEIIDATTNLTAYYEVDRSCEATANCTYGLLNTFQIWELEGAWLPLILAGIFAATLSSALGALVSAPKVFQAVCRDRLFPKIIWFAQGFGRNDEPRRGYVLFFFLAILIIGIGNLNDIAPIISNFFLMCYTLVNYACFDAAFAGSPGFRPGFRFFNKWLALLGAFLCLFIMFIVNWTAALITFALVAAFYIYILYRKPDVNWGSSSQAYSYKNALQSALKLSTVEEHVKNFRPQVLVLTGNPVARQSLVDFVTNITKESSLLICGHVVLSQPSQKVLSQIDKFTRQIYHWLFKRKIKAFYSAVAAPTLRDGAQYLLQAAGLGKMKPNILMMGMKRDWKISPPEQILEYFNIIHDAFDNNCGVGILNVGTGLDFSESMREHQVGDTQNLKLPEPSQPIINEGSTVNVSESNRALSVSESNAQLGGQDPNALISAANEAGFLNLPAKGGGGSSTVTGKIVDRSRYDSLSSFATKFQVVEEEKEKAANEIGADAESTLLDVSGVQAYSMNEENGDAPVSVSGSPNPKRRTRHLSKKQMEILASINQFETKVKKAVIHVWWLFDDGGLGLLIPHLLTQARSYMEGAKLRVFTVSASRSQLQREQRSMAALLSRFRIDYADVYVIPDLAKKPNAATIEEFDNLIAPFRISSSDSPTNENNVEESSPSSSEVYITDVEYRVLKGKTYRQLRTRELLLQHSRDASLIVLTLPIPRKGAISAALYLAWLEFLTRDLPPTLLLRGNQQSVLTFYS